MVVESLSFTVDWIPKQPGLNSTISLGQATQAKNLPTKSPALIFSMLGIQDHNTVILFSFNIIRVINIKMKLLVIEMGTSAHSSVLVTREAGTLTPKGQTHTRVYTRVFSNIDTHALEFTSYKYPKTHIY